MSQTPSNPSLDSPPRFSWPLRVLLFLVLFHMFFRSTDILYPWSDWLHELKIERMPKPLPTRDEIVKMRDAANGSYDPVTKAFKECFASLPRYWWPLPKEETRELLAAVQIRWGALRLNPVNAKTRAANRLSEGNGLAIKAVEEGEAAEKAGLKVDDVLIKINKRAVPTDLAQLNEILAEQSADAGFELVVLREEEERTIKGVQLPAHAATSDWDTALLWVKYALAWTATRLQWCECILCIDQEWPMFSPNVGRKKFPARARLIYNDGTEITIRQRSDPPDLTNYIRWSPGKDLGYDRGVDDESGSRWYACPGWCNILSHQHPFNDNGSPLKEIRLYQVTYPFPGPKEDARAFLEELMESTRDHNSRNAWPTFYVYNVENREGHFLKTR